jgi:hypothetical protein
MGVQEETKRAKEGHKCYEEQETKQSRTVNRCGENGAFFRRTKRQGGKIPKQIIRDENKRHQKKSQEKYEQRK